MKVGYVGFPAGLKISGTPLTAEDSVGVARQRLGLDLLLIPVPPFDGHIGPPTLPFYSEPESFIGDLASWDVEISPGKATRANIKRSGAKGITVRRASESDAGFMFNVYQQTVAYHRGVLRYTPAYFGVLAELATRPGSGFAAFVASIGERRQSYAAVAIHGNTGIYLHGGVDRDVDAKRPADLAVLASIEWARDEGAKVFTFQRSPRRQPGLLRFKEKWGGVVTADHRTHVSSRIPGVAKVFALMRSK